MQGPPPPPVMGSPSAPPIKKQRAGNTPEALLKTGGAGAGAASGGGAVSQRRAELQKLKQGMGQPTDVMDRARSSLLGSPPPGGPPRGGYVSNMNMPQQQQRQAPRNPGSAVRGGGRPASTVASASAGPPKGAHVFGMQQFPTTNAARAMPPAPAIPGQAKHHAPRTSDIFPTVPKSPTNASSKPSINNMNITHSPSRPNAAITAAAVKSPQQQPREVARRLDDSFSASAARSRSAPPSRPPPPPPMPPLLAPEDDIAVRNASKTVQFQKSPSPPQKPTAAGPPKKLPAKGTPHPAARNQAPPPEATSTPEETSIKNAGLSPESMQEGKNLTAAAGKTPFRPPASSSDDDDREPSPPATARRDLLRNMRAFADTPPEKSKQQPPPPSTLMHSPEQEEQHHPRTEKTVGFLSPVRGSPTNKTPRSSKHRVATPHPKRTPSKLSAAEQRSLRQEAAGSATFEYGGTPDQLADFVVRRPYGLATDQDLWFRAGQLAAKLYAKQADVDDPSTLEVVATISADGSLFTIYGENRARHQSEDGTVTDFDTVKDSTLGSVTYIDRDANEKEYSLDELYESAFYVREHYASSILSGADSLRLRGASMKPPPPSSQQGVSSPPPPAATVGKPETQDKAVSTDKVEEPQPPNQAKPEEAAPQKKKAPAPMPEDSSPDVLGSVFVLFISVIFSVFWFVLVGFPLRVLRSTLVLACSAVLLSFLWLQLADDNGAGEIGATMKMYTNRPGIM